VSVGKSLTINNASESSQITYERTNHKSLVQFSSPLGDHTHPERADVFRGDPLSHSWIQDAGNLQRDRQLNALFKSSGPHRHFSIDLPNWLHLARIGPGEADKLSEPKNFSSTAIL
jgi:hypothetical protein